MSNNFIMSKFLKSCVAFKRYSRHFSSCSDCLKRTVGEKIKQENEEVAKFRKEYGSAKLGEITVNQVYGGMRGMIAMVYEMSYLNPERGISYRGYTIPQLLEKLPRGFGSKQPLIEGVFWLLLTGDIPSEEQVCWLAREWSCRSELPKFALKLLETFPRELHPMAQLSATVTALHHCSHFTQAYNKGMKKSEYWEYAYEDAMDLMARVGVIAAYIFQRSYCQCPKHVPVDSNKDWAWNFACMTGFPDPGFVDLVRLYIILHCDHEGANVSAHATHLVGSALSDPYLSFAAGVNGLAGPLHGLANQEVLLWLKQAKEKLGDNIDEKKLGDFVQQTLKSGKVVPGYGHAVLRETDPRFLSLQKFGQEHMPDDPLMKLCNLVYKVVPPILKQVAKIANPWPNVDAHSGVLLYHYGMTHMKFYTVMFAVSRCLGVMAGYVWARGLGLPLERPKSVTRDKMMRMVKAAKK